MTRNLKVLGLAVFAVLALGALTAQGAAAHEFHSDGAWTVGTGANTEPWVFTVGTKGAVNCSKVQFEDTGSGVNIGSNTYASDTLTVTARFLECTFGGAAATINTNHCAFVLDSDTTAGNSTGGEHATVELECEGEQQAITVSTSTCTITVGPQSIPDALRYESDGSTSMNGIVTAHEVVVGNLNDKAGCVLFPKGKIGKMVGAGTTECFRDDGSPRTGTEKTTPTEKTEEGPKTECSVK